MRVGRPWHWFLLYIPFGATSGFVTVMLGYLAHEAKMDDGVVASLVAMNLLPHTWKFFWAPIADTTLTYKKWYLVASVISCATLFVMAAVPFTAPNIGTYKVLIFVNSFAITFLGMAVEGLMAHATPEAERGRAAGWFQAGNLGGNGFGGGIGLLVAKHVSIAVSFIMLGAILGACALVLYLVPNVTREHVQGSVLAKIGKSTIAVAKDLYGTLASRRGVIALVICFMPLGAGAAANLFSAIATRWGVAETSDLVSYTTGLFGGVAAAVGCLAGGWFSDRISRRVAYVLAGVFLAAIGTAMALTPRNDVSYAFFVLFYNFGTGVVYGCFTGFVLEVIGVGAIATKYNALASLSNTPIWYMTLLLGSVSKEHGPVWMLYIDALAAMAGLVVLLGVIAIVRPGRAPAPAVSSS
jgi:MFS family permease